MRSKQLWRPKTLRINWPRFKQVLPNGKPSILYYLINQYSPPYDVGYGYSFGFPSYLDHEHLFNCFGSCYEKYIQFLLDEGIIEAPLDNVVAYGVTQKYANEGHYCVVSMPQRIWDAIEWADQQRKLRDNGMVYNENYNCWE